MKRISMKNPGTNQGPDVKKYPNIKLLPFQVWGGHTVAVEKCLEVSPYQINVGHRDRPIKAVKALGLTNVKRHDLNARGNYIGRVVLLEGDYNYSVSLGKGNRREGTVRLCINETGMGMPTAGIISREMVAQSKKLPFSGGKGLFQIRVGTALGINGDGERKRDIGDVVVVDENVCYHGAIDESLGAFMPLNPALSTRHDMKKSQEMLEFWSELGGRPTRDTKFLINKNSSLMTEILSAACSDNGFSYSVGGTYSKIDLYGEFPGIMLKLYRKYKVVASEMEQAMNAYVADLARYWLGLRVMTGSVLGLVGYVEISRKEGGKLDVSGKPFGKTPSEKRAMKSGVDHALVAAADGLAMIKEKIEDASF